MLSETEKETMEMNPQLTNDIANLLSVGIALVLLGIAIGQLCDEIKDWYHDRTQRKLEELRNRS